MMKRCVDCIRELNGYCEVTNQKVNIYKWRNGCNWFRKRRYYSRIAIMTQLIVAKNEKILSKIIYREKE